ncbi:MAG: holo-ACP synthase [Clostridia bacterium]|nr:holo-ACP synthase [Clostridia bacterium]
MEINCGTDIIEIERIKEAIEDLGKSFLERIYTEKEIEYCENKKNVKYQHYAARFAAKEAVFKAISKLLKDKYSVTWKDVEVINEENGRPIINILNEKLNNIKNIEISISHCKKYAIANVIVIY